MSMNIKSEEAHQLAKELSALTGESVTKVVTVALQERLTRVKHEAGGSLSEQLLAIGKRCSERLKKSKYKILTDDDLYDELGLPK